MENSIDYEKISYGKTMYKRVQRLRKKGKRRGIEVPYLNHELTKPENTRIVFLIIAIISAILLTGILAGIVYFYVQFMKDATIFDGAGDAFQVLFDPQIVLATAGLSSIPAIMIIIAYLMLFGLLLVPLLIGIYLYSFVFNIFYMSKCSKEEFAKGNIVSSRVFNLSIILIISTIAFIVGLLNGNDSDTILKMIVGAIYAGIVIVLGGLLALILFEKVRCTKWFNNLDEDKKQNYLAHESALRQVKKRHRSERYFWDNITNFGK